MNERRGKPKLVVGVLTDWFGNRIPANMANGGGNVIK